MYCGREGAFVGGGVKRRREEFSSVKKSTTEPARDVLEAEFLEAIEQLANDEYGGKKHKAFVAWWVQAEYGNAKWEFTDDAGDGGIDAVVWRPGERPGVVLIQSKFSERYGRSMLGPQAYREFSEVVDVFHDRSAERFREYLSTVREDARQPYRKAMDALRDINFWTVERQAFCLITTLTRRRNEESSKLPSSAYRYADEILELYRNYRRGHTPRARDLTLRVGDRLAYRDPVRKVDSFLFNAQLEDFRKYFKTNDVARLVARNIRYNLAGRLGRAIRATYEQEPHDFWYLHNGITVICDELRRISEGVVLSNPSVVNGAQTLYAVSTSSKPSSPAVVPCRVVVRGRHAKGDLEDDAWVQKVIRGVNSQNRVRNLDFRSNEPEQLELQQLFRDEKVFYERKRGEFREYRNDPRYRGFARTSSRAIGMALAAVSKDDGAGVTDVKRGVEHIFDRDYYERLFPRRVAIRRRFKAIYFAYRLAAFVHAQGFRGSGTRKFRHAYWTAVWLADQGIGATPGFMANTTVRSIREGFDHLESSTVDGMRARAHIKRLRKAVWSAWRKDRKRNSDSIPVNFFKSKPAHRKMRTLLAALRPGFVRIARALAE